MYLITILVSLLFTAPTGYYIEQTDIIFTYSSSKPDLEVYISGNFNKWTKNDQKWKASYDPSLKEYRLKIPLDFIRNEQRSLYEFSFVVNGTRLDANKSADNVLLCPGYGYRYIISFKK